MSLSLAMGIIAIVNLAIGYALALMVESHQPVAANALQMPSDVPSPEFQSPQEETDPVAVSRYGNDPVPEAAVAAVRSGASIAVEPAAELEPAAPAEDANDCAEQLLASTTALAEELHQFARPEAAPVEPRAMLGDSGQLETALHEWWHDDPERLRPICVGQIEIDNLRQLTSQLDSASLGSVTHQIKRLILSTLRREDHVASLGRSRFLAVMPDVDGSTAAQLLEALRARVESAELVTQGGPIRATITAAAAQARNDDDVETLLARSASALREASGAGRNRVACDDGNAVTIVSDR
jgi:diguanylate cyclase (GGDEF)-like protein